MTIASAIQNAQQKVQNAYTAVSNKGGTLPATQDLSNLPTAIGTITTSGTVETLNVTPSTSAQQFIPTGGVDGYNPVNVSAVTSSIDANITTSNIKDGVTILGVTGEVVELNADSLSVTPTTSAQTITPTSPINGFNEVNVSAVTSSIDNNIKASNIKSGVTILGVSGTVTELNGETKSVSLTDKSGQTFTPTSPKNAITSITVTPNNQNRTVTPTTSEQTLSVNSGYSGNGTITVNAVTSSIDSNIQPENIKKDVVILGTTGTLEAGGGGGGGQYLVRVIDYDGTILKEEQLNENDTFTLPESPTHTGLTFQSWSSPITITNNTITVTDSDVTIGATYTTASGLSEFDITLTAVTGLTVTLNMNGTKNWGDGTTDTNTSHTYSNYGNYTITCDGTTMTTSSSSGIVGQSSSNNARFILTAVRLANITSISNSAFQNCHSLTSITIPSGVTSIGVSVFYCCYSLTSITIPSGVTSIGNGTFYYCYSLTSITIPSGVTKIGNNVFNYCNSLTSITIPSGVTSIGFSAFFCCYSLTSITIPSGVTSIGNSAFQNCNSLTSITIPSGVTSIGYSAFQNCYSLTSITIPSGVTKIDYNTFYYCYSLTSITIPSGVTSIGNNVFNYCYCVVIYDFSDHASIPTLSSTSVFDNINGICKIKVPSSLYNTWITASNWVTYADYIEAV